MTILVFLGNKETLKQMTNKELMNVCCKPINSICYNKIVLELLRRKKLKNKVGQ